MNEEILEERAEIIGEIFGHYYFNRNNNEVSVFCPEHSHRKKKLSVNVEKNSYRCWVCGIGGHKIYSLLSRYASRDQKKRYLETLGKKLYHIEEKQVDLCLPNEYQFVLNHKNSPMGLEAEHFLYSNLGLDTKTIIQNKIGFCDEGMYRNRFIFPSFDENGKLNYFITRKIYSDSGKKYLDCPASKKAIVYNELYVDWSKPVVIVESVKTYLRHFSVANVIPIMGTKMDERNKLFQEVVLRDCPRVFVAFDRDAERQSLDLTKKFMSYGIDCLYAVSNSRLDESSTCEFVDCLTSARRITYDDFLERQIRGI